MTYTWGEIEQEWLMGTAVALLTDTLVDCFNRVEAAFGREWVDQRRGIPQVRGLTDSSATLEVASFGLMLRALDAVSNPDELFEKLRQRLPAAWSELMAMYLLWNGDRQLRFEIEPTITVSGRERKPDFAVLVGATRLALVEVTRPDTSEMTAHLQLLMSQVTSVTLTLAGSYALEVLLLREPSAEETRKLIEMLPAILTGRHGRSVPLEDKLGYVFVEDAKGGMIEIKDRGISLGPILAMASAHIEPNEARHIVVRLQCTDDRAAKILKREASQLSKDEPGLVMIDTREAPGAMRAWKPMLDRLLHPGQHTRVSAVGLFGSGLTTSPAGELLQPEVEYIRNSNAALALPSRIQHALSLYPPWNPLLRRN